MIVEISAYSIIPESPMFEFKKVSCYRNVYQITALK